MLDSYEEIDGYENVTDSLALSFDIGSWKSNCGHYLIKQFEEEGNYNGFDCIFNEEGNNDKEHGNDWHNEPGSHYLNFCFTLDKMLSQISAHAEREAKIKLYQAIPLWKVERSA